MHLFIVWEHSAIMYSSASMQVDDVPYEPTSTQKKDVLSVQLQTLYNQLNRTGDSSSHT